MANFDASTPDIIDELIMQFEKLKDVAIKVATKHEENYLFHMVTVPFLSKTDIGLQDILKFAQRREELAAGKIPELTPEQIEWNEKNFGKSSPFPDEKSQNETNKEEKQKWIKQSKKEN